MNKEKTEKLYAILKKVLGVKITDTLAMDDVPSWDSLRHIQLLSHIEQAFGVEFDFKDTLAMTSVESIKKILEKYTRGK